MDKYKTLVYNKVKNYLESEAKNLVYYHGGRVYDKNVQLDFSVNLNPLGMPQAVKNAIVESIDSFQTYPDTECIKLRTKLSQVENVPMDFIVCGNGADDLIFKLGEVLKPKRALVLSPTFAEYERSLHCEVLHYFLEESQNFAVQNDILDYLSQVDTFYLCNPNNPTGAVLTSHLMDIIVNKCIDKHITLVVDECFLDFVQNGISFKKYLHMDGLRLVIIKAFTKSYSMAGIRLGYLITNDITLRQALFEYGQAWAVSTVAQVCGISALNCEGYIQKTRDYVTTEREYLTQALNSMGGFKVYPSVANYLLVKTFHQVDIYQALLDRRILVRQCNNYLGLDSTYLRFAVKSHEDNLVLVNTLKLLF